MKNNKLLINVKNLCKTFDLQDNNWKRFLGKITKNKIFYKDFLVLKNISFALRRGEILGIIGKNGSGKSTLLKLIAGRYKPTSGQLVINGNVSAIIELNSNLNPQLTGVDNIKFNLNISNIPKQSLKASFDKILDFADLDLFINQPVKNYSSGMKSRLAFAIATHCDSDILIIDEVLSVGDYEFRVKCLERINELSKNMAIIFVSHSMNTVKQFCSRVLVLDQGQMLCDSNPSKSIDSYLSLFKNNQNLSSSNTNNLHNSLGETYSNPNKINLTKINYKKVLNFNAKFIIDISFALNFDPKKLTIGIPIFSSDNIYVTSISNDQMNYKIKNKKDRKYKISVSFNNIFNPGNYYLILAIHDGSELLSRSIHNFSVNPISTRTFGVVTLKSAWESKP